MQNTHCSGDFGRHKEQVFRVMGHLKSAGELQLSRRPDVGLSVQKWLRCCSEKKTRLSYLAVGALFLDYIATNKIRIFKHIQNFVGIHGVA